MGTAPLGLGTGEALILLLLGGLCAVGPLIIVFVFVMLGRQAKAWATPEARAKGRAGLLPWRATAFGDLAAELDVSWTRGQAGTTLSGRVPSVREKDRAWALLYARKTSAADGEVVLSTAATELRLELRDALATVTQDGAPLGTLRLDTAECFDARGNPVATLGPAGGEARVDLRAVDPLAPVLERRRPQRQLTQGGRGVARIGLWKPSGPPVTPLVQVAGALPETLEPWLLAAVALELGWHGADQPKKERSDAD